MNHGYYQDRLSAYFDQALTGEEMQMIKEHLTSCAECRARLDDLARLDSLIEDKAGLGESDYWETAARKIEDRLTVAEESKVTVVRSGWFGLGWKLAAAAASIAALTFV
ncbi:MAG: zf-HC2 domain-containing protein, partial [candidate division Zixibacteria bacterium]|nr:zf-HC2 domain-containing protein [candidate division Zixibacteria bacterium]